MQLNPRGFANQVFQLSTQSVPRRSSQPRWKDVTPSQHAVKVKRQSVDRANAIGPQCEAIQAPVPLEMQQDAAVLHLSVFRHLHSVCLFGSSAVQLGLGPFASLQCMCHANPSNQQHSQELMVALRDWDSRTRDRGGSRQGTTANQDGKARHAVMGHTVQGFCSPRCL